jgi:hypothetical protein
VIPLLEAKGLNVNAVLNPLTSLAEDLATTRRILVQEEAATILVGHSYADFVVTEAGNRRTWLVWCIYRRVDGQKVSRMMIWSSAFPRRRQYQRSV